MIQVQGNRHIYFWLLITFSFPSIAEMETSPIYDPRLSEFVWFSTFTSPIISMPTASSTDINIMPLMMPGPLGSKVAAKENKNKVNKVEKFLLRLK